MVRLRHVSPHDAGWSRRRSGRGFTYLDESGDRLAAPDRERCVALVIPPAWDDVWICARPNGHIQATGVDVAGRRQYLYHPSWREQRDLAKHERVLTVAERLPRARKRVAVDLGRDGMPYERALATAFRLLDLGFFRVGGEAYAEDNGSYGLSTLRLEHVAIRRGVAIFDFTAKSGKEQHIEIDDDACVAAVGTMRRRRGGADELLAYKQGGRWRDVTSDDVNDYVRSVIGAEMTAKDFRTWHATVIAAMALACAGDDARTKAGRRRAAAEAMREVADYLGNTPAVAKASYVDPRVVDLFDDGVTIDAAMGRAGWDAVPGDPRTRGTIERAVLALLTP